MSVNPQFISSVAAKTAILFIIMSAIVVTYKLYANKHDGDDSNVKLTEVAADFSKTDIGSVKADTTITFRYLMVNVGEDRLKVLSVNPDCNCTGYELSQNNANKGDSIILTLDVDMRNKHKGRFMLSTVICLNTKQRLYPILITGEVK